MNNLQTTRLILRPFVQEDLPKVFEGLSHPQVIAHYGISYESLEKTQEQMDWFKSIEEKETGLWRAIIRKDDFEFLGAIGINNRNIEHKNAELGYWLLPHFWRQGYLLEAGLYFCDKIFKHYDLHRLEAQVETENRSSIKTIEALGFRYEGTKRDCELKNYNWISLAIYGKIVPLS